MNPKKLSLTFYSESWLHIQVRQHGWQRQGHTGPDWMAFGLHHHDDLCGLKRDPVEGQRQGSEAAGFTQEGCPTVWVCAGNTRPGCSFWRGRQRRGGHRQRSARLVPHVVGYNFIQVSFGLLQLCKRGVDFQRPWHLHIQLTCGKEAEMYFKQAFSHHWCATVLRVGAKEWMKKMWTWINSPLAPVISF